MSLKIKQNRAKCYCNSIASTYCNNSTYCMKRQQQPLQVKPPSTISTAATVRKSSFKNPKANQTNFVRVKRGGSSLKNGVTGNGVVARKGSSDACERNSTVGGGSGVSVNYNNRRGCGHSQQKPKQFSRRNSAATSVTFSSSCASPAETNNRWIATPRSVASSDKERFALSPTCGIRHEHTEQRRYYETAKQLMALVETQLGNDGGVDGANNNDSAVDDALLRGLQKFRLQNANECFTVHRQLDLNLQPTQSQSFWTHQLEQAQTKGALQAAKLLEKGKSRNIQSAAKQPQKSLDSKSHITPYAVRQQLLRLRIEAEEIKRLKPGRKLYGMLENSCALRFQETC